MASPSSKVFGSARIKACVTALGRRNCQRAIGKDVYMSTVNHRPPLFVPSNFRFRLSVSYTLQTHWLA